jgi:tricarballylate dehydrogenase
VAWEANAPETGDFELTTRHTKQSYPLSIVVNTEGRRFLDEGAELRNHTYAKYGARILLQPGACLLASALAPAT